jgi:hypothetical protein
MAQPGTIKGGKVRLLLDIAGNGSYSAPCGLNSRSVTFGKGLEAVVVSDCDEPDDLPWEANDAVSRNISISGEGVLAVEAKDTWFAAWESNESIAAKLEIEWPSETDTFTGNMQIGPLEIGATNGRRVTLTVNAVSDGEMVRTTA